MLPLYLLTNNIRWPKCTHKDRWFLSRMQKLSSPIHNKKYLKYNSIQIHKSKLSICCEACPSLLLNSFLSHTFSDINNWLSNNCLMLRWSEIIPWLPCLWGLYSQHGSVFVFATILSALSSLIPSPVLNDDSWYLGSVGCALCASSVYKVSGYKLFLVFIILVRDILHFLRSDKNICLS